MENLTSLALLTLVLVIVWQVFALVGDMARERGHSPWPWWLISFFWSPFGSMFVLWLFFQKLDEEDEE